VQGPKQILTQRKGNDSIKTRTKYLEEYFVNYPLYALKVTS
jgi:hypothetical protein